MSTRPPADIQEHPVLFVAWNLGQGATADTVERVRASLLLGAVPMAGEPGTPGWTEFLDAFEVGYRARPERRS